MRVLVVVQALLAAGVLGFGAIALFGVGITGLLFVVPGLGLAALAGVAQQGSRAAVGLCLAVDAVLAAVAMRRLATLLDPEAAVARHGVEAAVQMRPGALDVLVPSVVLLLSAWAVVAVGLDWRRVRAARWF